MVVRVAILVETKRGGGPAALAGRARTALLRLLSSIVLCVASSACYVAAGGLLRRRPTAALPLEWLLRRGHTSRRVRSERRRSPSPPARLAARFIVEAEELGGDVRRRAATVRAEAKEILRRRLRDPKRQERQTRKGGRGKGEGGRGAPHRNARHG